nr:hypothetical protein [Tanacetum cinerariifolium]
MALELVDRSITRPKGVVVDIFVKVGKFHWKRILKKKTKSKPKPDKIRQETESVEKSKVKPEKVKSTKLKSQKELKLRTELAISAKLYARGVKSAKG